MAAVLVIAPAFAIVGALATYQASGAAKLAGDLNEAFETARYAVGGEESLERKYRLQPSPEVRARHRAAAVALTTALQRARAQEEPSYVALIDDVLVQHKQYLLSIDHMFAAIDDGDAAGANEIDEAEVDPTFAAIEARVDKAAAAHRAVATEHLNRLEWIQTIVLIATPAAFVISVSLAIVFWRVLRALRRRADEATAREGLAIRRREQRFRSLIRHASDLVLICAPDGAITYQSPAAELIWGYSDEGLLNRPLIGLVHPDDQPALRDLLQQSQGLPGTTRRIELRLRSEKGVWRFVEFVLTNLLREPTIDGLVATVRDITERKAFEGQLINQAFHDSLTGLPNRALLRDRLKQALARASRRQGNVAVLFIDLDNFKLVNDGLGHQAGDSLLVEAARRLRECVRDENTIVRLGGDEFVVVLDIVASAVDAAVMAERIARAFERPFAFGGRDLTLTASIGIALGGAGHDEQPDSLLRNADLAMYRAKAGGKARHVAFDERMQSSVLSRLELESDLRRAVELGEMRVYYQPIVALDSGRIEGVEALVRWRHPTRGLVSPVDFIPVAEETGLIVPIGKWVLEEACRQAATWRTQFPSEPRLTVSVNLSPRQFQQPALIEQVERALSQAGLPANSLKLEITEGAAMRDVEATISTLRQLRRLGIKIAIDDFGTGYSSLAYLKRLPIDVIKIDRSFIQDIGQDQETTAIVRAIISMAKALNLTLTAEGVETVEQSNLLRAWNCDRGQGYLFARPMDAETLTALLPTGQPQLGANAA
jgi:diguanylate cyclase (GGDEF)-like protein/PAS domain S-box-containing protein